jgi:hypothetical protein
MNIVRISHALLPLLVAACASVSPSVQSTGSFDVVFKRSDVLVLGEVHGAMEMPAVALAAVDTALEEGLPGGPGTRDLELGTRRDGSLPRIAG